MSGAGVEIEVAGSAEDAARACAEQLAAFARAGGHIALTGGSTPELAYELAAELEPDWSRVELWWGDDRCVPPEHEWSNYGMAKRALIDRLAVAPRAVHRMQGELGREAGADAYERELASLAAFDLVLLGLGPDGHVASLYPRQPTLEETERRAIGAEAHLDPYVDRITLTLPTLRRASEVLFLIAGDEKADAAARALAGPATPDTPGSLVRAELGPTRAIVDRAAATKL